MIKVGVLIPDRGDRPEFLWQCYRMLSKQTLMPAETQLINDVPVDDKCDITPRYRKGYAQFNDVDVIAFIENDDWYRSDYLETMAREWDKAGRPDLFGTNYTIYYHIGLRRYFTMEHLTRASAMNTLIKPGLKIEWPQDHDPFLDMHLWMRHPQFSKALFKPAQHISLGIKHGVGKAGGKYHSSELHRYAGPRGIDDTDYSFLQPTIDPESFKFYSKFK